MAKIWLNKDSFMPQIENYTFENVDTLPQVKSDIDGVDMYISNEKIHHKGRFIPRSQRMPLSFILQVSGSNANVLGYILKTLLEL